MVFLEHIRSIETLCARADRGTGIRVEKWVQLLASDATATRSEWLQNRNVWSALLLARLQAAIINSGERKTVSLEKPFDRMPPEHLPTLPAYLALEARYRHGGEAPLLRPRTRGSAFENAYSRIEQAARIR